MLSNIREIKSGGTVVERTPLLVPSFSSKGFWDIRKVYETVRPLIDRPVLVSAYDIFHGHLSSPTDPAGLLFLDSGGYEASKDGDLSDYGDYAYRSRSWGKRQFQEVLSSWDSAEPTVYVSYDHPEHRISMPDQIQDARDLLPENSRSAREILVKPEKYGDRFLDMERVVGAVEELAQFDLIGMTEKELGRTAAERMRNIALLRRNLNSLGAETPIHIFGSLDTYNTILYFISGADVFDGLTWLRFSFSEGQTVYKNIHSSLRYGLDVDVDDIDPSCWFDNYGYLRQTEREMRKYAQENRFDVFRWHGGQLEKAFNEILQAGGFC